jgi:fumarylacetoacetase
MVFPYGIFSYNNAPPRMGVWVGDSVLDLKVAASQGFFKGISINKTVFAQPFLNDFIALGKTTHQAVQQRLQSIFSSDKVAVNNEALFQPRSQVTMHLPIRVGDYTDFYAGIEHARHVGQMFRPDGDPLLPNYRHMPIAYHGRASSIVVSGTPIKRPHGQLLSADQQPIFGPTRALDFELELGIIIGKSSELGQPISIEKAEAYVFGFVLFNDWSARDIQRWEYQPLGPFLGKSFASSVSPWVVPLEALEPYQTEAPTQVPTPLPYLQAPGQKHYAINFDVILRTAEGVEKVISRTNSRHLYWSVAQMIAHHTSNGCNLNVGDLLASGTISGTDANTYGSLLELSWNGTQPLHLSDNTTRTFLEDGDTLTIRGWAGESKDKVDFGEVSGTIVS